MIETDCQQVVSAQTIGSFKRRLDSFMDGDERGMYVIKEYWSNRNCRSPGLL